jgi:hypothetical protein
MSPLLQVHVADASQNVDLLQCTQPPFTHAKTGFKRLRKERQGKTFAELGETTPVTQRTLRSTKTTTLECEFLEVTTMQQTPMPQTDVGNEYGPPPLESTPARKRGKSSCDGLLNSAYAIGAGRACGCWCGVDVDVICNCCCGCACGWACSCCCGCCCGVVWGV